MASAPPKIAVVFYRPAAGVEVVRDWLRQLDEADRNIIGQDLMRVQFRWPVGMPLCRPLGGGFGRCEATCLAEELRECFSALREAFSAARLHQENPEDAAGRFRIGAETETGIRIGRAL